MISLSLLLKHRVLDVLREPRGHLPGVLYTTTSLSLKQRVLDFLRDFRGHLILYYIILIDSYQLWWLNSPSGIF